MARKQSKDAPRRSRTGRWVGVVGVIGVVGAIIGLSIALSGGGAADGRSRGSAAVGSGGAAPLSISPAPDFTATTRAGPYTLSQQKGKVLLLYFSFPG